MTSTRQPLLRSPVFSRPYWQPTRIAGACVAVLGLIAAAMVAASGLNAGAQAKLITAFSIVLLGIGALAVPQDDESGGRRAVMIVLWMVAAVALVNLVFAWIDLDQWIWRAPSYFPVTYPVGADFRAALSGAQIFSNEAHPWPPFNNVLLQPYLLLGTNGAYAAHLGVLLLLNVGALVLGSTVARAVTAGNGRQGRHDDLTWLLAPVLGIWLFLSFGFLLSLERGAVDAFAACLMMLGLWCMVKKPGWVWLPTVAFSLAAQIKFYPAVLLLLVIWRYKWKSVLPIVACNVVLALSAGPQNLMHFFHNLSMVVKTGYWVGNSSADSFSWWIDSLDPGRLPHIPPIVLLAVPIVLFLLTAWPLLRRKDLLATVLMLVALLPLMFFVPSTSNDYKVVMLAGPAILLVALIMKRLRAGSTEAWWMLLALTFALFFIARVPGHLTDYTADVTPFVWPAAAMNKYPWILLLQLVTGWMAWRLPAPSTAPGAQLAPEHGMLSETETAS